MARLSAQPTQFITLPLELLHSVLDFITKRELKSLRQTNKFLHKLSTPLLFECFNVYPHKRSFQYLINAAESPHIGPLIRYLRFDAGYLGLTDMIIRRLQNVYTATLTEEEKNSIMEHARHLHKQSLQADSRPDEIIATINFGKAFSHLSNLETIQLLDACESDFHAESTKLPSFYEQLAKETCGRSEHTRLERGMVGSAYSRNTYVRALLMAMHELKSPLRKIELRRIQWTYLLQQGELDKHMDIWSPSFAKLKSLELATAGEYMPSVLNSLANLQALLRPAINLEELSITFRTVFEARYSGRDMKDIETDTVCQSVFQPIPRRTGSRDQLEPVKLTWSSKLCKLRLEGLVCTMKEIKSILKQSASTLRRLELRDFVLMPDTLPGNRACLVALFKWMQKHLQLEEILLRGFLTNGGMQAWFLGTGRDREQQGLLAQVQKFILKGGTDPLEHVAIAPGHFDLHKKTYSATVPESLIDGKYDGDDTFSMDYEDYDEDDEDDFTDSLLDEDEDDDGDFDDADDLFLGPVPLGMPMPMPMPMVGGIGDLDDDDDLQLEMFDAIGGSLD